MVVCVMTIDVPLPPVVEVTIDDEEEEEEEEEGVSLGYENIKLLTCNRGGWFAHLDRPPGCRDTLGGLTLGSVITPLPLL